MGVVYSATNRKNGKIYVGLTTRTLQKRVDEHIRSSREGSNTAFHAALRRYGTLSFAWQVHYRSSSPIKLGLKERELIREFDCRVPNGYNITEGGELGSGLVVTSDGRIVKKDSREGFRGWVQDFIDAIGEGGAAIRRYRRSVGAYDRGTRKKT